MTLIVAAHLPEGIILLSDSRVSWGDPPIATKDLAQKVFELAPGIAITFSGDIEFAGIVVGQFMQQISRKPEFGNIRMLAHHAKRIMQHCKVQAKEKMKRNILYTEIFIAGSDVSHSIRGELESDDTRRGENILVKYGFNFKSENEVSEKYIEEGDICSSGSGCKLFPEKSIEELIDNNADYENLRLLMDDDMLGFLRMKAQQLDILMKDRISSSGIVGVGGKIQRLSVDHEGIRLGCIFSKIDGKWVCKEGYANSKWNIYSNSTNTLHELLDCNEIVSIDPYDLSDQ